CALASDVMTWPGRIPRIAAGAFSRPVMWQKTAAASMNPDARLCIHQAQNGKRTPYQAHGPARVHTHLPTGNLGAAPAVGGEQGRKSCTAPPSSSSTCLYASSFGPANT